MVQVSVAMRQLFCAHMSSDSVIEVLDVPEKTILKSNDGFRPFHMTALVRGLCPGFGLLREGSCKLFPSVRGISTSPTTEPRFDKLRKSLKERNWP
eukprot:6488933-Amphidinium_carterae.1